MVKALLKAANRGDLAVAEQLLDQHPDWAQHRTATHALCAAARRGDEAMVALLHQRGFDLDAGTHYGDDSAHSDLERPLHWAAAHGYVSMVRWLLDHGADVHGGCEHFTPLVAAARAGHRDIYTHLLGRGAGTNLFSAAAVEPFDAIASRLEASPALINLADEYGTPPLHVAAELWRPDVVRGLLERGADVGQVDRHADSVLHLLATRRYDPTLHWGSESHFAQLPADGVDDQLAVADLLGDAGVDVNAANWRNLTPLHRAVRANRISYVQWLLDHGAEVNAADVDGMTPLHRAATTADRIEVAELLLRRGADRSARARDGRTPADCARAKTMRTLLA